jgi:hypothetical protein
MAPSKLCIYKPGEIDLDVLAARAESILHKKPFTWQLEIADAILQGNNVIVDIGTGSGKTLCFALPLLKDKTDVVLVILPLTALMVDQVRTKKNYKKIQCSNIDLVQQAEHAEIATVAVCAENMARVGVEALYKVNMTLSRMADITDRKIRIYCQANFSRSLSPLRLQHLQHSDLLFCLRESSVMYFVQFALMRPTASVYGVEASGPIMQTLESCVGAFQSMYPWLWPQLHFLSTY